jgi:type I restriction modification DNA specificity domain protein
MSRINDLIKELCPNGVAYVKLEELVDYIQPAKYIVKNTNYDIKYDVPVLTAGQTFILGYTNERDGIYYASADNPVIIFDDFTTSNHWVDFNFKVKSSAMKILISKTDNLFKYIYYCISNIDYVPKEHSRQWIQVYSQFQIPLPPLKVQEEIVRILDKFGELEAELEAELETRKSQYEFWRGNLLFNPNYPVYKMEDICIINQGLQIPINQRKKEPGENRYFYITVQFLKNEGENYYIENPSESVICKKDDILVTRTGSTGKIVYGVEGCFHNNFFKVTPIINLNKKYLYHVLNSTQMFNEMLRAASGGTVPDLPHKKFYKLEIGLPSIEEQKKIVTILDKFENLISDISIGLPAEIELRRKQYKYYRNKLLSFEELSCE